MLVKYQRHVKTIQNIVEEFEDEIKNQNDEDKEKLLFIDYETVYYMEGLGERNLLINGMFSEIVNIKKLSMHGYEISAPVDYWLYIISIIPQLQELERKYRKAVNNPNTSIFKDDRIIKLNREPIKKTEAA